MLGVIAQLARAYYMMSWIQFYIRTLIKYIQNFNMLLGFGRHDINIIKLLKRPKQCCSSIDQSFSLSLRVLGSTFYYSTF